MNDARKQELTRSPIEVTKAAFHFPVYIDSLESPYATFRFRYRPKDILQAQGIITKDSDIVVLDGPPPKKECCWHSAEEDVNPLVDISALRGDGEIGDDADLAAIENQIRSLTEQLERKRRSKKRRAIADTRVKKEKLQELDIHIGESDIIELT
ncbi:hypothetical protein SCP_0213230 [Sparassis crispa]|uniref:Uncharacterized protein n=1 Tax=Sparassis crispa TaxID=139825 RepID=A0A401GD86_9APHY|nr:hypothetical protein SCP_0213230 [Sparassis crispa]GBE80120.1 hypothetical protein SCP_0213230 [Sparassis crispa]